MVKDYPASILALSNADKISPNDYRILYFIGKSLLELGEYSDAALIFRKALKIKPNDRDNWTLRFLVSSSLFIVFLTGRNLKPQTY